MPMNNAILRNSKIVIFDKKNNLAASWVSYFFPSCWIVNRFFFHVGPRKVVQLQKFFLKRIITKNIYFCSKNIFLASSSKILKPQRFAGTEYFFVLIHQMQ